MRSPSAVTETINSSSNSNNNKNTKRKPLDDSMRSDGNHGLNGSDAGCLSVRAIEESLAGAEHNTTVPTMMGVNHLKETMQDAGTNEKLAINHYSVGIVDSPNEIAAALDVGDEDSTSQYDLQKSNKTNSTVSSKTSCGDRLQRSRERNRIHARKTRQRKKEQMQNLQHRAEELKNEQIQLRQSINEKNTASILVGLFSEVGKDENSKRTEDPTIEALLRRPVNEIPDASKLPELPALILPGQHNSKKVKAAEKKAELPNDGIDYELLGKDRSKCTPAELDQIRRERNRMHAKRTRDRKRLFMEEMAEMCKTLETENDLLRNHLDNLSCPHPRSQRSNPSVITPPPPALPSADHPSTVSTGVCAASPSHSGATKRTVSQHGVTFDQIKTLLDAAGAFSATASAISASTNASESGSISEHDDQSTSKRRRLNSEPGGTRLRSSVPESITTTSAS